MSRTKDIVYASFPLLILLCLIYVPGIWLGGGKPTLHIEDLFILAGGVSGISRLKGMVPRIRSALYFFCRLVNINYANKLH
jgi:hypothetical protein